MTSVQSPATTRQAMQWTADALGRRLVRFRNLTITVGIVILVSLVASIALRSWRPLLGLLVLVPLCGVFWCRDATWVGRWQGRILALWCEGRLDRAVRLLEGRFGTLGRDDRYVVIDAGPGRHPAS